MNPKIQGQVTLEFVRAGVAKASSKPYLMVANGRKEVFLELPKGAVFDFSEYNEGDEITLEVEVTVGSDKATLVDVVQN